MGTRQSKHSIVAGLWNSLPRKGQLALFAIISKDFKDIAFQMVILKVSIIVFFLLLLFVGFYGS